jgi:hypothetical protein
VKLASSDICWSQSALGLRGTRVSVVKQRLDNEYSRNGEEAVIYIQVTVRRRKKKTLFLVTIFGI